MFTGLISHTAKVIALDIAENQDKAQLMLQINGTLANITIGESIAINGCCLTVIAEDSSKQQILTFSLLKSTLACTNLGKLKAGSIVNVERSLQVGARLGGHWVQGHVDNVANVISIQPDGDNYQLQFAIAKNSCRYLIDKGSITIDGISLTIAEKKAKIITVCILQHTWQVTNLCHSYVGYQANIEVDLVAKYIENFQQE